MDLYITKGQRKPYDDYHSTIIDLLSQQLSTQIPNFSVYYYGGGDITPEGIERYKQDPNPIIVTMTTDYHKSIQYGDDHPWSFDSTLEQLKNINKIFIILTSIDGVEQDFDTPSNVFFVHFGSDILLQMTEYPRVTPVRIKNFDTRRHFISLSLNPRPHRLLSAMVLLGHSLGLDEGAEPETGMLRISNYPLNNIATWQEYFPNLTASAEQSAVLTRGFELLQECANGGQPAGNIYDNLAWTDNATNFERDLRKLYTNSFVEIINGTLYFTKGTLANEKYLNSVYGFNLPIFVSTPGTVAYFRSHGFDMFDDVVDHTYDSIEDPIARIFSAIENNKDLLSNKEHTQEIWFKCLPRFEANYKYAKDKMYEHFQTEFKKNLAEVISKII